MTSLNERSLGTKKSLAMTRFRSLFDYPVDLVINQLVRVSRPGFGRLHLVPVLRAVVVVAVEAGPLVADDVVHPERVGHASLGSFLALLLVLVESLL